MSYWLDTYESHIIHEELNKAISLAEPTKELNAISPDSTEKLDRIRHVLHECVRRLGQADPNLIPLSVLNGLSAATKQIISQLTYYNSNQNVAHVTTAVNHLEGFLTQMLNIPSVNNASDVDGIADAAVSLRRSLSQHLRRAEDESSNALERIEKLNKAAADLRDNHTRLESEFNSLVKEFRRELEKTSKKQENYFASLDKKGNSDLLVITNKFGKTGQKEIDEQKAVIETVIKNAKEKVRIIISDARNDSTSKLEKIEEIKLSAEKMFGAITNSTYVGGYQKHANSNRRRATWWKCLSVFSIFTLVVIGGFLFILSLADTPETTFSTFATRFTFLASLLLLSGYSARQAKSNEQLEKANRDRELSLALIMPLITELPQAKAQEFKIEIARELLTESNEPVQQPKNNSDDKQLQSVVSVISEPILAALERLKP